MKKITIEDYMNATGGSGSKWIGKKLPKTTKTNTLWKCEKGHTFYATYDNIVRRGSGCRECSGYKKKTVDDYRKLAHKKGFKWAGSKIPQGANYKTEWICNKGHRFLSSYTTINQGHGCPHCKGNAEKTIDDYKKLKGKNGIKWAGEKLPKNTGSKTKWMCRKKHIFKARYDDIKRGRGCPECKRKSIEDYKSIAGKDGTRWNGSKLPRNTQSKTKWICDKGHTWFASYSEIVHNNRGCPICSSSKGEYFIASALDTLGIEYEREKKFSNLRSKGPLRFDFFIKDHNLLIEYHGAQHYREVDYFIRTLRERQKYDKIKENWAHKNGYKLIVIPYWHRDKINPQFIKQLFALYL